MKYFATTPLGASPTYTAPLTCLMHGVHVPFMNNFQSAFVRTYDLDCIVHVPKSKMDHLLGTAYVVWWGLNIGINGFFFLTDR